VVDSAALDFYAVLQVHPSADQEVIEAAFRQLMKKHHPDVAGTDPRLAAQYHERAKVINQAHSVLRDPIQRRRYDSLRSFGGSGSAPPQPPPRPPAWSTSGTRAPPRPEPGEWIQPGEPMVGTVFRNPFAALSALYYLLPGPYEWEGGHGQEMLTTCLVPPVGIAAFALATGRLTPLVGNSTSAMLLAWGVLLVLLLPGRSALPRLAMASVPTILLMSGRVDFVLRQASVPVWLAWVALGMLSLVLSGRLYVFAVLPTLAGCWLVSRFG
jgi:hypothetical protein